MASIATEDELKKANRLLEEGKIADAKMIFAQALGSDYYNSEVKFAHWCCSYWSDFIVRLQSVDFYEQAEGLIARWKSFKQDSEEQKFSDKKTILLLQKGIFSLALSAYDSMSEEGSEGQKSNIFRKRGLCNKKLGKYEVALDLLTEAHRLSPQSAPVLAEMADCLALCGETKNAKVLFREAFFLDAQRIEIEFLDSELICCLIRQVKEKGYTGAVLQEWIPVYGVLYGVFSVKRELRMQEASRLRQEIFSIESEIKDPTNDSKVLIPKLINMYFWLIDHYAHLDSNESGKNINECLLQIRLYNEDVYKMYTKKI